MKGPNLFPLRLNCFVQLMYVENLHLILEYFCRAVGTSRRRKEREAHTGSFAQNSFQIDSINSCCTSKKLEFRLKFFKIIYFLLLKPIKGTLGFILEIMKKIARWRQKSEISKRYVKTMISLLSFRL